MHLRPWQDMDSKDGPEPDDFPEVVSSAPVEWKYHGNQYLLHFHAGMFGLKQDPETFALSTVIGWVVSHDPPQEPEKRLAMVEQELTDIKKSGKSDWVSTNWLDRLGKEKSKLKSKTNMSKW